MKKYRATGNEPRRPWGIELEGEAKTVDHNLVLVCRVPGFDPPPRPATPDCTHVSSMSWRGVQAEGRLAARSWPGIAPFIFQLSTIIPEDRVRSTDEGL